MDEKNYIYIMKGIAIFCVVCAHVFPVSGSTNIWNRAVSDYLNYMGTMGVPIFFILSGYLFGRNKKSFKEFWKRKIKSVFIPWFFCETLLWLYVVLRKGGMTLKAWLQFLIGYQHTTYYLTVLIIMYLLFWVVKRDWELTALAAVSIFSMVSTGWDFGISFINKWTGTFYLNPLNWICFFVIGIFICRKDFLTVCVNKAVKILPFLILVSVLYFVVSKVVKEEPAYFSKYALAAHMINILLAFGLAAKVLKTSGSIKDIMIYTGKISFPIYLLHQFIAGILVRVTNYFDVFLITLVRPFLVVFMVTVMIWFVEKICNRSFRFMKVLIGIRE